MTTVRNCLVLAAALVAIGCEHRPGMRRLPDGRVVPRSWETVPLEYPGQSHATRPLEANAVYVVEPFIDARQHGWNVEIHDVNGQVIREWNMTYYRFWPSGEVLQKIHRSDVRDDSVPTAAAADDFAEGAGVVSLVGRYSVVGDRLTIAMLGNDESGTHWYTQHGRVNDDGTITFFTRGPALTARPHVIEGMQRKPDW